jgi:hypothetical protein
MTSSLTDVKGTPAISFNGVDYDDFLQLVGHTEIVAIFEPTKFDSDQKKVAYAASHFTGSALQWLLDQGPFVTGTTFFASWSNFQQLVQTSCCGITDSDVLHIQRATKLDDLKLGKDLPLFFAEFERLTRLLGTTSSQTRMAMIRAKLPRYYQDALAANGIAHGSYQSLKTYLLNVWSMRPPANQNPPKPKCGKCGKKGHKTESCTAPAKN